METKGRPKKSGRIQVRKGLALGSLDFIMKAVGNHHGKLSGCVT